MKTRTLLAMVSILVQGQVLAQNDLIELNVGDRLSKSIPLGGSDGYRIRLEKNQFALLNLKQMGMDVKITTYTPDGVKIEEFDSPNGDDGNEIILVDAGSNGWYEIEVSPLGEDKKIKKGEYEIELIGIHGAVGSHLDEVLRTLYGRRHLPGFGVSILNAEEIVYHNAMGYADLEEKRPYTVETVQNIASISKTFIGLSLAKLVEQEKLTWDTPINETLPFKVHNPYFPDTPITVRHLATHTSTINEQGFYHKAYIVRDNGARYKYDYHKHFVKELKKAEKNQRMSLPEFLERHLCDVGRDYKKKNFFKAKPGEEWYYSNVGASLAAYIVELSGGEPYKEFVQRNIIGPLDLKSAVWSGRGSDPFVLATQYDSKANPLPKRTTVTYPDGEMYVNVLDLSNYLMMFIQGNAGQDGIIGSASLKELMKVQHEQTTGNFKGRKDGFFWEHGRNGAMGHSGGDYGVSAYMYFDPDTHSGYTYIGNVLPTETDYSYAEYRSIRKVLERYAGRIANGE